MNMELLELIMSFLTWAAAGYLIHVAVTIAAVLYIHGKGIQLFKLTHPFILFLSIIFLLWRAFG